MLKVILGIYTLIFLIAAMAVVFFNRKINAETRLTAGMVLAPLIIYTLMTIR